MSDENILGQKRRNATTIDGNSSSKHSTTCEPIAKKKREYCDSNMTELDSKVSSIHQLVITNIPGGWTCNQVMDYVRKEVGESALLVNDFRDTETDFQIKLKFKTVEQRNKILEKLKIKQALGLVCVDTEDFASDEGSSFKTEQIIENRVVQGQDVSTNISIDVWDVDPKTLYGLKESFLTSLEITPPLSNWVLVNNFRCDRSELKEVLELAGHVVVCHVVTVAKRYANVMYSHPLEAVQAISMLNGQTYYGQTLKITMDNQSEYWKILPKGLANLGPGLGKYGKPVRNIAKEYERFISGKSTFIETKIFKSEKSTDLLKEIILPSLSRLERSDNTPELVIDTEINEHKVKDESPKEEIESENNDTPDLENQNSADSEITAPNVKDGSPSSGNTNGSPNGTHTDVADDKISQNSVTFNKPITNFGQNSGTNGQLVRPFNNTTSGANPMPYRPTGPITQNITLGFGMQRMQDSLSMQGMQRIRGPQPMQVLQGPQPMQAMPGPQPMQGMQITQAMRGIQPMQGIQVSQAMHVMQPMQGMHRPMGPREMQNAFRQQGHFGNNQTFVNQGPSQPFYPNQMSGNVYLNSGIQGTMQAPVIQPNVPTRPVGPFAQQQSVRPLEIYRGMNAFTLKIVNIPSVIKMSALCDKLSEFGQVTGLELSGPGTAVVKYQNSDDAERCFRNYRQIFQY